MKIFLLGEIVVDESATRAHLLDISLAGSRLHTGLEQTPGSEVRLRLNGQDVPATVVWIDSRKLGLKFRTLLTQEQVERLTDV